MTSGTSHRFYRKYCEKRVAEEGGEKRENKSLLKKKTHKPLWVDRWARIRTFVKSTTTWIPQDRKGGGMPSGISD